MNREAMIDKTLLRNHTTQFVFGFWPRGRIEISVLAGRKGYKPIGRADNKLYYLRKICQVKKEVRAVGIRNPKEI